MPLLCHSAHIYSPDGNVVSTMDSILDTPYGYQKIVKHGKYHEEDP